MNNEATSENIELRQPMFAKKFTRQKSLEFKLTDKRDYQFIGVTGFSCFKYCGRRKILWYLKPSRWCRLKVFSREASFICWERKSIIRIQTVRKFLDKLNFVTIKFYLSISSPRPFNEKVFKSSRHLNLFLGLFFLTPTNKTDGFIGN